MNGKKIVSLFVVALSIGISAIIIGNGDDDEKGIKFTFGSDPNSNLQFESEKSFLYPTTVGNVRGGGLRTENLTELLAQAYTLDVVKNIDPTGSNIAQNLPPSNFAAEELSKKLKLGIEFSKFELKDISVSNDNSSQSQLAYLETVAKITEDNFRELDAIGIEEIIDKLLSDETDEPLREYVAIISEQINDLLSTPVPTGWGSFHVDSLNLWQKKFTLYKTLFNFKEDPLKAYMALDQVPQVTQETERLQGVASERYQELTL